MTEHDIHRWEEDEVTQLLFKRLSEAEQLTLKEMVSFSTEAPNLTNRYFYVQGKLAGIRLTLEADLGD